MGWIAGYSYRKNVTINNTGKDGAQANYQLKVIVNRSAGADSGQNVYVSTKCLANYNDIRFTKSDGSTLLDHWLEGVFAGYAVFWVEVDAVPDSSAGNIYLYYGNASASSGSNGDNTFLWFDHFDTAWNNPVRWTGDTGSASVASSIVTLTNSVISTGKAIFSNLVRAGNVAVRSMARLSNQNHASLGLSDNVSNLIRVLHTSGSPNHTDWQQVKSGAATVHSNNDALFGAWNIYDLCRVLTGTDTGRYFLNNSQQGGDATINIPVVDLPAFLQCYSLTGNTVTIECDWILLRNYTTNEPLLSTWGSEENAVIGAPSGSLAMMGCGR